jgi:flagellar basal body-associated protein FliL
MSAATARSDNNRSVWTLILGGAALIATLALGAWGWQKYASPPTEVVRPVPIYLSIDKIESKMSDGSVLAFKFGLQLKDPKDQQVLGPYAPAFRSMVANLTTELSYQDLAAPGSMTEMGGYIEYTLNDYLTQKGLPQRIQGVLFEDWLLLM